MSKATKKHSLPNKQTGGGGAANNLSRVLPFDEKQCHKIEKKPKEYVIAYDVTGMRKLFVPDRNPIDIPGIFPKSELERLKNQAHIVTLQDRKEMLEETERKKDELQKQSEERKEALAKAQQTQIAKAGNKMTEAESAAKAKKLYLLKRSHELLQEQDDRVKAANRVIFATKCRAIRNCQIAEKELIEKQLQEEDRRLDQLMEQQRQKSLDADEQKKVEEEQKRQRYIKELSDQMMLNEVERLVEAERVEEESRMINKAFLAIQKEEEEKLQEKKMLQQKIRDELKKANDDMERYKLVQEEEQRIADMRIANFMQQKMDRELAREQELALAKAAKEQEIARMRMQQQKALDRQAAVDEMNALRAQEEVERKWRESEMAAVKKRKDLVESLRKDREDQVNFLRRAAAVRLARDEKEFHKVAQIQRKEWEKEQEKKSTAKEEAVRHRKELLRQINEKERQRIDMQKEKFEEGKLQRLEEVTKNRYVREHLQKKIDQLRADQLPEQYLQEIEIHVDSIIKNVD